MRLSGNCIFITGGGSGIGRALARRFHELGNHVVVGGRSGTALEETAAGHDGMDRLRVDVTDPVSVDEAARQLASSFPELNVLINNAGLMRVEDVATRRDMTDAELTIATNLRGPMRLTNALIDQLAARPNATVVNVTSGLAFVPLVSVPSYCAAKAGLHSYTIALRERLKGRVEVIELAPPGVQTELMPGQSTADGFVLLPVFTDSVFEGWQEQPTRPELAPHLAQKLRSAEADGTFDELLAMLGTFAAQDLQKHAAPAH